MKLLGYGEDALTYWALTQRLADILQPFGDSPNKAEVVFFRPSFGRRSSSNPEAPNERGAQFGEFDAIVSTSSAIYLIEAKWTSSGEVQPGTIELRDEQVRRHQILRRYIELWAEGNHKDWDAFSTLHPALLIAGPKQAETCQVAPNGSRLASNIEAVLRHVAAPGKVVRDVVLVVHPGSTAHSERRSGPQGFEVVEISCPAMDGPYIDMSKGN